MSRMSNKFRPRLQITSPTVHATHPFTHIKNHKKLLEYLMHRVTAGASARDRRIERFRQIDRDVAGWVQLSPEDKERESEKQSTGRPMPVDSVLPIIFRQIDDAMTYFMQVFAPESGFYHAVGSADNQSALNSVVEIMNEHATHSGAVVDLLRVLYDGLKYNVGGALTEWAFETGQKIQSNSDTDELEISTEIVWQGNRLQALDMYNTFWDGSVHSTQVPYKAEYAGWAELISEFRFMELGSQGMFAQVEAVIKGAQIGEMGSVIYKHPPKEVGIFSDTNEGLQESWDSILGGHLPVQIEEGIEQIHIFCKLVPRQFGLVPAKARKRDELEIWRFTISDQNYITRAIHMNNAHGQIPMNFLKPHDSNLGVEKSWAEYVEPMQRFASFLINTHVLSARRNLWNLTVYDESIIPLSKIPKGEVTARVPITAKGQGKDIRNAIWQNSDVLDTSGTLNEVDQVLRLLEDLFPAQARPSQVAGMDRAVKSQVMSVVQGSTRRMQKTARLIGLQFFRPAKQQQAFNLMQFQNTTRLVKSDGSILDIDPVKLREAFDQMHRIGTGIKSIDREQTSEALMDIIDRLVQIPGVNERIDIIGLIDYVAKLKDSDLNILQFDLQKQKANQQANQQGISQENPNAGPDQTNSGQ